MNTAAATAPATIHGTLRGTTTAPPPGTKLSIHVRPDVPPKDAAADKAEKAEKEAAAKLILAQTFLRDRPERARERLEEIVKNYPDTKAAKEAKELLAKLKK